MPEITKAFETRIADVALDLCIDPKALRAIIEVESAWDTWAVRYEHDWPYVVSAPRFAKLNRISTNTEVLCQRMSWGLGQVMGGTARDFGFEGALPTLLDPDIGIFWAGQVLRKKVLRWPNLRDYISAYNAGSPSKQNAAYVEKVIKVMDAIPGGGKKR